MSAKHPNAHHATSDEGPAETGEEPTVDNSHEGVLKWLRDDWFRRAFHSQPSTNEALARIHAAIGEKAESKEPESTKSATGE